MCYQKIYRGSLLSLGKNRYYFSLTTVQYFKFANQFIRFTRRIWQIIYEQWMSLL